MIDLNDVKEPPSRVARGVGKGIVSDTALAVQGREGELLSALGITVTKRGHIRCPTLNHEDCNPSWRFDFRKGRWYCSCGSGDILDLIVAMGRAHNVLSAAEWARRGLALPPLFGRQETPAQRGARERQLERGAPSSRGPREQ